MPQKVTPPLDQLLWKLIGLTIIGGAVMDAQQRGVRRSGKGNARFDEPDMGGQGRETDTGGNVARLVKHRVAQTIEPEAAPAFPAHGFGNPALLALNDFAQARGAMGDGVLAHFDADIAAAHFVGHGGGRAGTQEGI